MGATCNFFKLGVGTPTGKPSGKSVGMSNGQVEKAMKQVKMKTSSLCKEARLGDELPSIQNNLVSVPILANNGYTTIFFPGNKEVEIHHSADVHILAEREPVLRGWRDRSRLWPIPLVDDSSNDAITSQVKEIQLPEAQIHHLYRLPSVEARVAYIHACLGFSKQGCLVGCSSSRMSPWYFIRYCCKYQTILP